jgi:hypothetical protein
LPAWPIAPYERPTLPADLDGNPATLLPLDLRRERLERGAPRAVLTARTASPRARRRAGFLLSEFFAAAPIDVDRGVLDRGPGRRYDAVSTVSLTDLTMALLLAAIEGRDLNQAVDRMERDGFVAEGPLHGPWLTRLPDVLRDALAAASADDLCLYAAGWLCAVELAHADLAAMIAVLGDLAVLARSARDRGDALYLWTSL